MRIVCSISTVFRIVFWMIVVGFVLGLALAGTGTHAPAVGPSAPAAYCQAGEEANDPCSRT